MVTMVTGCNGKMVITAVKEEEAMVKMVTVVVTEVTADDQSATVVDIMLTVVTSVTAMCTELVAIGRVILCLSILKMVYITA